MRTHADLTVFVFVWGERFVSVIVCIIFYYYLFPSWATEVTLILQSYWSLSCDNGLHCSDELMSEQQQPAAPIG